MNDEEVLKNIKIYITNIENLLRTQSDKISKDVLSNLYIFQVTLEQSLKIYERNKTNINKLIRYIAIQENKDYEDIEKEFELWGERK